jgi:hypothetical protein
MIDITSSQEHKGFHVYEGTFKNTYFKLTCKKFYDKLICDELVTEYGNKEELICMLRQCGIVDI